MEKVYFLQGLGCANCAGKIETAVKKLDGVLAASVNFMTTTLKLSVRDGYSGDISAAVEKVVHKYEPEIVVMDKSEKEPQTDSHGHAHGDESGKGQIIQLIAGAVVFGAGILFTRLYELNIYLELGIFLVSYIILGRGVVLKALKNITKGQIFDENFLMSVATIGAFAIGDFPEAVAVMLFYQVGEYFQSAAVRRSKKSIADLMDIRPDSATVKRGGKLVKEAPETIAIGDIIVVKPGEKIPLDGESTVAKIIDLVENASSKKAPTENFITTFSRYYTPVVVGLAALLAVIPPLFFGGVWSEWINRGLIFLVISCPCALVISIPLGFFGGIGSASKKGVLVKGSNYLEALNNLDIVVFDKTGTLTKVVFKVTGIFPANGFAKQELLECAANAEALSNHPIALSILKAYEKPIDKETLTDYSEISGHGIRVIVGRKTVLAGNEKLMKMYDIAYVESTGAGTKVYVAVDNQFAGCIVIADEIKEDSKNAILGLKQRGVRKAVMLTGDNVQIGGAVANELRLDEVYAQLLPDQKVEKVEMFDGQKRSKGKLAFVGDGINDAPVLARADAGIAMGGLGSDAAIEAADVVLMTDEPSKLLDAIDIAKFTKRIVWQNIAFALGVKGIFLLLGAFGIATMWEAVFADVGVSVIAILNAMRVLKR